MENRRCFSRIHSLSSGIPDMARVEGRLYPTHSSFPSRLFYRTQMHEILHLPRLPESAILFNNSNNKLIINDPMTD